MGSNSFLCRRVFQFLASLPPLVQVLVATFFTWAATAAGASVVFSFKQVDRKVLDAMLGFAAGVMIAASYWSLLAPAIEMYEGRQMPPWLPAAAGFLAGGVFLRVVDKLLPHLHPGLAREEAEGVKTSWRQSTLLMLAVTLHNIPEGLAVGVTFGALATGMPGASMGAAVALAMGIAIQNLPEGLAVALPLRRAGLSRLKSFLYGQLSAVVEPLAGAVGFVMVVAVETILPYALAFAAGAMIFVVIEELIPEAQRGGNTDVATMAGMLGFAVMMVLDVAFG